MRYRTRFSTIMIVLVIFISAGLISCEQGTSQGSAGTGAASQTAPDFTLTDLSGKPFTLSGTRGKVVILDFWATWCPPCRMEVPHFQSMYEEYKDKGLVIVGVALDRTGPSAVMAFAREFDVTYPVVMGDDRTTALYGGIRSIPTTFIIDRQGRITDRFVGYRSREVFEEAIKGLL